MSSATRLIALSLLLALLVLAAGVAARPKNPWQAFTEPAPGQAKAIGDYSGGCVQGAAALPLDGAGYQVMHPSRLRYYGHPELVDFVRKLGQGYQDKGHGVLLIGDLSQPRGGRASGGHASHQSGLDVDIWFWHPRKAATRALTRPEREQLKSRSVLNGKTKSIRERWARPVHEALRLTAEDARVQRVFVHPIIKRQLCQEAGQEREWLRKIRPWYGHDDHFHVRLFCPADSPDCEAQDAIPEGDGCGDDLAWWFDEQAQADRREARKKYQRKVISGPKWPPACDALLEGSAPRRSAAK